jgi:hypothetical protein
MHNGGQERIIGMARGTSPQLEDGYDDFMNLPAIGITHDALAEILRLGTGSRALFSCNSDSEVWLASKRGRIPIDERVYLDLPALEEIAAAVVHAWPSGGRFEISAYGVKLTGNDEPLFGFEMIGTVRQA